MAGKIVVEMSGEESKLLGSLRKVINEQNKTEAGYKKVGRASDRAGKQAERGFGSRAVSQLKNYVLGMVSVQSAIQLVTGAMREFEELGTRAADKAISRADAHAAVIKNIGDVNDEVTAKFLRDVEQISTAGKLPSAAPALMASASILSATSGDREKTKAIVKQAIPFFRDVPEQLPEFGGALADVMRITQQPAKPTTALLLSIFGQARFTELGAFKNVARTLAVGEVVAPGDRMRAVRESAALVAGVGGRIADPEASQTGTAVANLMANLQAAAPKLGTTFERLATVQKSPALQEQVLSSGFRGAVKPIIADLVSGAQSQTSKEVMAAFEKIQAPEAMVDRKRRQLEGLTSPLGIAGFERAMMGQREEMLVGGASGTALRGAIARQTNEMAFEMQAAPSPGEFLRRHATNWIMNTMLSGGMDPRVAGPGALIADVFGQAARGLPGRDLGERVEAIGQMLKELQGIRKGVDSLNTNTRAENGRRGAALRERNTQKE